MAIDGVSRDLVEKADAGIFVQPENPEDFAIKIKQYLSHPSELIRQGENGYQFAKDNFDRMVLANRYLNLIQQSLK
jgi:glycosyltransferase involved in cell wall biosynthesis